MEHVIENHSERIGLFSLVGPVLVAAVLLPQVWMQRMRRRRELMGLLGQPDYLLKDVGIDRAQITNEGLKPFWTP